MSNQTAGLVLLALAGWLLWSAWALVLAGAFLVVAPEVAALARARRAGRSVR